ncbi:MAG: LytTR family transcriptional regulator DNA-binding domain-containing protein [Melioribacteraceae bacterium]|nr:LytTR family transcriptional regulator DNA-binding domain-containing protein [Melioribacteraceae bacterium]
MEKIKTVIIDDEKLARDIIKNFLSTNNEFEIIAEASNGFEGIKLINELKPDLIFLDVQMPKINGFEMLELIENPPLIIFTTAFDQYAIKAFEINAIDYLLKPFSKERFNESLERIKKIHLENDKSKIEIFNKISNNLPNQENLERIVFKNGSKINVIDVENIIFIEAQDDYTMFYTKEGNFLKQKTMKYFEENLDPKKFIRTHRSYIVKLDQIKQIDIIEKESYQLTLFNSKKLPVSKSGYSKLKELFN